jgi:predicted HicB family RNase H-like nuclease
MTKRPDKTTLSIPPGVKRKARAKALLQGKSLSSVVTELLRKWLEEEPLDRTGESQEQD